MRVRLISFVLLWELNVVYSFLLLLQITIDEIRPTPLDCLEAKGFSLPLEISNRLLAGKCILKIIGPPTCISAKFLFMLISFGDMFLKTFPILALFYPSKPNYLLA